MCNFGQNTPSCKMRKTSNLQSFRMAENETKLVTLSDIYQALKKC